MFCHLYIVMIPFSILSSLFAEFMPELRIVYKAVYRLWQVIKISAYDWKAFRELFTALTCCVSW